MEARYSESPHPKTKADADPKASASILASNSQDGLLYVYLWLCVLCVSYDTEIERFVLPLCKNATAASADVLAFAIAIGLLDLPAATRLFPPRLAQLLGYPLRLLRYPGEPSPCEAHGVEATPPPSPCRPASASAGRKSVLPEEICPLRHASEFPKPSITGLQ